MPGLANGAADLLDQPALDAPDATQAGLFDLTRTSGRLVAVGEHGVIITRDSPADRWQQRAVPISTTLTAVAFNDRGVGLAVGHDGVILRSTDNGDTWARVIDGRELFLPVIAVAKARLSLAERALSDAEAASESDLGDYKYLVDDEAFRLETAEQSLEYGPAWPLLDVAFAIDGSAWAVGAYGMVFRSPDGGETWELVSDRFDNTEDFHLNAILEARSGTLIVAGEAGLLFRSSNGGESFTRFDSYDGLSLFGLAQTDAFLIAYGFGDSAQVSVDDGETWEPLQLGEDYLLVGDMDLGDGRIGLLGSSGALVSIGLGNPVDVARPTGTRFFLSGGVSQSSGDAVFTSEAGILPSVEE
ncbi:MAG: YCF48-related protein [Pseudomonadota bacterium]